MSDSSLPRVLFWPLGNPTLESATRDAKAALENLRRSVSLDITSIERMTWWQPFEIPKIMRSLKDQDFDLIVIFSATFATSLCIAAIVKRFKIPTVIWASPLRYALATSGLASSFLRDRGYWIKLLNNEPEDSSVRSDIELIAKASRVLHQSRKNKIGIIGKLSPLMLSLPYDLELLKRKLGASTIKIGIPSLDRALNSVDNREVDKLVHDFKSKHIVKVKDEPLAKAIRFQLAVRSLVKLRKLDGIALECWTNLFPKYGVNPCLGHLDDLTIGCEGDVVSLAGSLILKTINGVNPFLTDILSINRETSILTISHCAAPASLSEDPMRIRIEEKPDSERTGKTAFAHFEFKNEIVTLVRFYGRNLDKIHLTWGRLRSTNDYFGSMRLEVMCNGNAAKFLEHVCGNHYLVTYGDVRPELRLFAEWNKLELIED